MRPVSGFATSPNAGPALLGLEIVKQADTVVTLFRLPGRSGASGDPGGDGFLRIVHTQSFHSGKPLYLIPLLLQAVEQIFKICGGRYEPINGRFQLRLVAGPSLCRRKLYRFFLALQCFLIRIAHCRCFLFDTPANAVWFLPGKDNTGGRDLLPYKTVFARCAKTASFDMALLDKPCAVC